MTAESSKSRLHYAIPVAVLVIGVCFSLGYALFGPPDLKASEHGRALLIARDVKTSQAFRNVIQKYPNTYSAKLAAQELPKVLLNEAKKLSKPDLYRDLIKEFPSSNEAKVAKKELPQLLLRQARNSQSVMDYFSYLSEFPNEPESANVKSEVHKIYQNANEQFRSHFTDTPQQVLFIEKLAAYLENSGNTTVEVRFVQYVTKNDDYTTEEPYSWDKEYVLNKLKPFFKDFHNRSIELKEGEPLKNLKEAEQITRPTIAIDFKSEFNGSFYSSKGGGFASGENVTIKISMRIPGESVSFDLSAKGRTPSSFTVSNKDEAYQKTGELATDGAFEKLFKQWKQ